MAIPIPATPECVSVSRVWDALRRSDYQAEGTEAHDSSSIFGLQIPSEVVHIRPETRIAAHTDPRGPTADRLRLLRLRLNQVWNREKLKRLLITSPLPHDGKSTIALNLAVTLAEEGERAVLLIEGDLHRATVSKNLGLAGRLGVAECLESGADARSLVRRIEPIGCYFLPAGNPQSNPTELLQGGVLPRMMDSLSPHFDWILIDSPPVAPLTDALSWKDRADATLLVIRAGRTPTHSTEEALNLLDRKHVLSIILNGVEGLDSVYRKYYKSYYTRASS
jgi:capsular exopolysaccharide synthesis family protein